MKIFITGGTGFVGTHVVKELAKENDLLLLTRKKTAGNLKAIHGDLSDIEKWKNQAKKFRPDASVHLAWQSIPNYDADTSIKNLSYGLKLVKTMADIGCRTFLSTGSCWEYGQQKGKLSEGMPVQPHNAFSTAKNALHWLGAEIAKEKNMNFIWTRLFYVYGPGQKEASLIPYLIKCAKNNNKPEIKNPHSRNDFVYVEDVARAIEMILRKCGRSAVYNIGSGKSTSIHEVTKAVYGEFGLSLNSGAKTQKGAVNFWADISKIKKEINWKPKIYIREGIQNLLSLQASN